MGRSVCGVGMNTGGAQHKGGRCPTTRRVYLPTTGTVVTAPKHYQDPFWSPAAISYTLYVSFLLLVAPFDRLRLGWLETPVRRVQQLSTYDNLAVLPQNVGPPVIKPSPSLPTFTPTASPSPSGIFIHLLSKLTKWTSSVSSSTVRRPVVPGPGDSCFSVTS